MLFLFVCLFVVKLADDSVTDEPQTRADVLKCESVLSLPPVPQPTIFVID